MHPTIKLSPRSAVLIAFCVSVSACTKVGPDFRAPENPGLESAFTELHPITATDPTTLPNRVTTQPAAIEWWTTFNDPELNALIIRALRSNYDLQIATARILEARAQRNIIAADLFPEVDADAGEITARGSKNVKIPLGANSGGSGSSGSSAHASLMPAGASSDPPGGAASGSKAPGNSNVLSPFGKGGLPGVTTSLYQAGFDANWELDIFGGTARRIEAANYDIASPVEARHYMQVTLLAEVARDYIELRSAQARLAAAHDNLATAEDILEVSKAKAKVGLTPDLDVTRASAQAYQTAAAIPPLEAQIRRSIHALSTLLAMQPDALSAELTPPRMLPSAPPSVPIGLPSDLLLRRPDIREALRRIGSANAHIGAATADLFPKFALTGSVGVDSSNIENLLNWQSRYFLLSPTVSWPVFDAGRIVSNISLQKSLHGEAILQYRKTVLEALQEVEDNLIAYASEQSRNEALRKAEGQAEESLVLARSEYKNGLADFLTVLDAQRTLLGAEDALIQSNGETLTALVALYKSLGGGWQVDGPEPVHP